MVKVESIVVEPKEQEQPTRRALTRNFYALCSKNKSKTSEKSKSKAEIEPHLLSDTEIRIRLMMKDFTSDSLLILIKANYAF